MNDWKSCPGDLGACRGCLGRHGSDEDGWVSLFDGKTLSGWTKAGGKAERASGRSSMAPSWGLASLRCSIAPRGTTRTSGSRPRSRSTTTATRGCISASPTSDGDFSKGYEAQIDSTHRDPIRTGSIYGFVHIYKQIVPPDTWFTYEVECIDKNWRGKVSPHIKVWINGKLLYELQEKTGLWEKGYFAFQQHDPGSKSPQIEED